MIFRFAFALAATVLASSLSAQTVPFGPLTEVAADPDSLPVVAGDGTGWAILAYLRDESVDAALVHAESGAVVDLGIRPGRARVAVAASDGRFAVATDGALGNGRGILEVFDTSGARLFATEYLCASVCRFSRQALGWAGSRLVFARSRVFSVNISNIAVAIPMLVVDTDTGTTVEFFAPLTEAIRSVGEPQVLMVDGEIQLFATETRVDLTKVFTMRTLDLGGEVKAEPVVIPQGRGLVIDLDDRSFLAGLTCRDERCAIPILANLNPDGSIDPLHFPVPDPILAGSPSLRASLVRFLKLEAGALATRALRDGIAAPGATNLHLILDSDGGVGSSERNVLRALTDTNWQNDQGIDLRSVDGDEVAPGHLLLTWVDEGKLLARGYRDAFEPGPQEEQTAREVLGCTGNQIYAEFTQVSGTQQVEVRRGSQSGELLGQLNPGEDDRVGVLTLRSELIYFVRPDGVVVSVFDSTIADCPVTALQVVKLDTTMPFMADVEWDVPTQADRVEVRLRSPHGKLFTASTSPNGSARTQRWVTDSLVFFLLAGSGDEEPRVIDIAVAAD